MDLYTSSNGWLAWVERDPVANSHVLSGRSQEKRFVIVGFLPTSQFCIAPDSYESVEQAQELISNFDKQTIAYECREHLIKVFTCFDGSYWWQHSCADGAKYPPERIYTACNTTEAVELVGSQLECCTLSNNRVRGDKQKAIPRKTTLSSY